LNDTNAASPAPPANRLGRAAAFLALALGLAATGFMWNIERHRVALEREAVLAERANYLAAEIRQRLVAFELALRGGASLFAATENPTRAQWRAYVDALNLDAAYPGVQGVAFSAWLEPDEIPAVERAVRGEGFQDFRVWPEGRREEASAILYIEPLDAANGRALGYDMYADPVRKAAMAAARDKGRPVMTGQVSLVQDAGEAPTPAALLYVPAYRYGEAVATAAQRRQAFLGWVYAPFRPADLLASLDRGSGRLLAIRLFDGPPDRAQALLYASSAERWDTGAAPMSVRVPIEFGERVWTLQAFPRAGSVDTLGARWHWEYLAGGVLISLMLFFLVRSLATTRDRAYALAETMTEALRHANAALDERVHARTAELREANEQLREQVAERERAERQRSAAFREQAERNGQLRAMAQASVAIGSLPDTRSRLDYLAHKACEILKCRQAVVVPHGEPIPDLIKLAGQEGLDAAARSELLRAAEGWRVPDRVGPLEQAPGVLAVPIRVARDRTRGVLYLTRPQGRPFTGEEQAIVRQLVLVAAASIAKAEAAEDERRARLEAEAANALKDRFLAIVSHELRTPLQAILGWLAVIERRQDASPNLHRALQIIRRNAETQRRLIDDLLDLARIEQGKLQIDRVRVDLGEVVQAVVDSQRTTANEREVELVLEVDSAGVVEGDPLRLQQVVGNLIGNALKFTPPQGRVVVKLRREQDELVLVVADNGQGIEPSMLDEVFDQFRQADPSSQRRHGGLGLGLSLVRDIVTMHAGRVVAESAGRGHGACFSVRLPLANLASQGSQACAEPQQALSPGK
jgi:signal transduction histidine kinase/CHASE1-domain containing sensor protein